MKYDMLGPVLRSARTARSLEQADIARAMGVGQQAVSAWEVGTSRPRIKQLPALADILGIEIDELRRLGEYERTSVEVRPRLLNLPFEALTDAAFEAFCRDLGRALFPRREVTRNGSKGFKQFGVDVIVDGEGERIGIQCKRHETFGPSQVDAAVHAVLPEARIDRGVIALSRSVATPRARLAIARHSGWVLWDGEDLSSRVRSLSPDSALTLVDAYFPGLREPFLGVAAPSPWRRVTEFDTMLAGRLGYDRDFELTGRDEQLNALFDLVSQGSPLVFLVGRGGIGKTRLLSELGRAERDREIRYASSDPVVPAAYELLPPGDPVVVVDDAGENERVAELVAGIRIARPDATVVLSTRPRTWPDLLAMLGMTEVDAAEVRVEVGDLDLTEAEQLARRALGTEETSYTIERLARVGYDCPLLIVIGAHLLRIGKINETSIGSNHTLRQELLTHFADALVRGTGHEVRGRVLDALAALQPANLDQAEILTALQETTALTETELLDSIDELEDIGVVLRRGATVRVVPDLLGEALLERALVGRGGRDRRFAAALAGGARGVALTNAIRNVSIVDWGRRHDGQSNLADVLWAALDVETQSAGNWQRIGLMTGVQDVAAIYPGRALNLAATIMARPAPDEVNGPGAFWGGGVTTAEDCNRSLAPLIRNVAYTPGNLEPAMDMLRTIGSTDKRPENQNPNHAMRLLRELADYGRGAPIAFHMEYVRIVRRWIAETTSDRAIADLIGLLKGSLASQVMVTRPHGLTIEFSHRPVNLDVTAPVRRVVLDAAGDLITSSPVIAAAAIDLLEEALRAGDRADPITEEFRVVTATLGQALACASIRPSVRLAAYRALSWHAKYGQGPRRELARKARSRLLADVDLLVTRMIRGGWGFDDDDDMVNTPYDFERVEQEYADIQSLALAEWAGMPDDTAVEHLLTLVRDEEATMGRSSFPDGLATRLFEQRPAAALWLLKPGVASDAITRSAQGAALTALFTCGEIAAVDAATSLMTQGEDGALTVAGAVLRSGDAALGATRTSVIKALRRLGHPSVERMLVGAMRWFKNPDRGLIIEIIETAPVKEDSRVASEVAAVLTDDRVLAWEQLSEHQRDLVLDKLAATPTLSDYSIEQLLSRQLALDPARVLRLLMQRIDNPQDGPERFDPIPFAPFAEFTFRHHSAFPAILAELIQWLLQDHDWRREFYGYRLFELVVGAFDAEVLDALALLISSREASRIALAANLLTRAGHNFVLANVPFVVDTLAIVDAYPDEWARQITEGLIGSTLYGVRGRTVGEDDPAEVALREEAARVASQFPLGSAPNTFYNQISANAARRLMEEREDDKRLHDPRKW